MTDEAMEAAAMGDVMPALTELRAENARLRQRLNLLVEGDNDADDSTERRLAAMDVEMEGLRGMVARLLPSMPHATDEDGGTDEDGRPRPGYYLSPNTGEYVADPVVIGGKRRVAA